MAKKHSVHRVGEPPAIGPGGGQPPPPVQCVTAPSSYMTLPTMRAALVKWARTVDLVGVQEIRATLQK